MPSQSELNDLTIRSLKPPARGKVQYPDNKVPGLSLRLSSAGTRTFNVRVRHNRKYHRIFLGRYPELSLAQARKLARQVRAAADAGTDPSTVIARQPPPGLALNTLPAKAPSPQIGAADDTAIPDTSPLFSDAVEHYARAYLATETCPNTARERKRNLNKTFAARFNGRTIGSITFQEILSILEHIRDVRKKPSASLHAYKDLNHFFNWHVSMRSLPVSPMQGMRRPTRPKKRDRYLKATEIKSVWDATCAEPWPYGTLAKLMLLTAQRRSEVAGMRWDELNLRNGTWTIPASRTKNRKEHVVPISNFAAEIIVQVHRVPIKFTPGQDIELSPYVFPAPKNPLLPVKWISHAKARIERRTPVKDWTLHDMRRTAASTFGAFGVDYKARKKILNHAENSVTDIYDRFEYFEQRCEALHLWAEHVRKIINGELTAPADTFKNPFLTIAIPDLEDEAA